MTYLKVVFQYSISQDSLYTSPDSFHMFHEYNLVCFHYISLLGKYDIKQKLENAHCEGLDSSGLQYGPIAELYYESSGSNT